jgi:hypothetical protein
MKFEEGCSFMRHYHLSPKFMKITFIPSMVFFFLVLILLPGTSSAQAISINSVSGTSFCSGDQASVTFTASGDWSQNKNNTFTIQLSDINGSFESTFTNLGSIKETVAGTFTVTAMISDDHPVSTHYRIRVTGAYPFIASLDNGQDITIGRVPTAFLEIANFSTLSTNPDAGPLYIPVGAQIGDSVKIKLPSGSSHTDPLQKSTLYDWDFGSDATPQNASGIGAIEQNVTYSTSGDKTVTMTLTGPTGCTSSTTIVHHIFDCTNPPIPKHAIVDSGMLPPDIHKRSKVIWVNSGVTFETDNAHDTIFCEPNSTIIDSYGKNVVYLKPGASYSDGGGHARYSTIIFADGVSLDLHKPHYISKIHCPNLDFNYTNAPPNVAHPLSVKNELHPESITLFPNPTGGKLLVQGLPSDDLVVSVFTVLGETAMEQKTLRGPDFSLDLTTLVPGTYYIRFASMNSVVTKKIIKQ